MFGETRFGNTGRGEGHTGAAASLALDRGHQPSLHCVIGGGELGPVQANLSKKTSPTQHQPRGSGGWCCE